MQSWMVPVKLYRRGPSTETDPDGQPIPGPWVVSDLPKGLFAPGASALLIAPGVAAVEDKPAVYWPAHKLEILPEDELEVVGRRWRPSGNDSDWPKGTMVRLEAVTQYHE